MATVRAPAPRIDHISNTLLDACRDVQPTSAANAPAYSGSTAPKMACAAASTAVRSMSGRTRV
jgi:hypothetical protein